MADPASFPEPLAVWDCNDRESPWWHHQPDASKWAIAHLPDRGIRTYRLDFHLIDTPFAVAYRYAEDVNGRRYLDPATGEIAAEEPAVVLLDELPAPHLLGQMAA